MIKAIIILDQIQAGLGGKEKADTPYGGKRLAMGSAAAIEQELKAQSGTLLGTFYCGTNYYHDHASVVQSKFAKMAEKMAANLIILGPTYDYPEFSQMACELGAYLQKNTSIAPILALAQEKNTALIDQYHEKLTLVKMPKKGGGGVDQAISDLVKGGKILVDQGNLTSFKANYCY